MGADEAKMERVRLQALRLTEGWDKERVRDIVAEVLEEVISPLIYAEALELIHDHSAAGRLICIVSSSPEEIVEPLATMLRIDTYIATRPRIVDGRYTGELDFYCYGVNKPEAIKELAVAKDIDLAGSFAYSDSGYRSAPARGRRQPGGGESRQGAAARCSRARMAHRVVQEPGVAAPAAAHDQTSCRRPGPARGRRSRGPRRCRGPRLVAPEKVPGNSG